jgi:hypothetical protein
VSEFAPPQYQRFLSYVVGWVSTLSWQAGNAADCFLTGTISQALIVVNNPKYVPQRWEGTLLVFAMVGSELYQTQDSSDIPDLHRVRFEHLGSRYLATTPERPDGSPRPCIPRSRGDTVVSSTPPNSLRRIYRLLQRGRLELSRSVPDGRPNIRHLLHPRYALQRPQESTSTNTTLAGSDATAHMAEEVRDASRYVPISLFWSYFGNSLMATVFLIGFLFAIDDVHAAISHPSGFPFLYVFTTALRPAGVNTLTIIVLILVSAANVNFGASTARQTFAFARDRGLPFSTWIARVDDAKGIPSNAVLLSSLIAALLTLINIGSATAFNAIVSLQVVSLMFTYAVSLSCILYRRLAWPESLPSARWSLGRWGVVVNVIGLAYVLFACFWSFWPTFATVDAQNFNWAGMLFLSVFALCLVMYHVQGKHVYMGPVKVVRTLSDISGSTL